MPKSSLTNHPHSGSYFSHSGQNGTHSGNIPILEILESSYKLIQLRANSRMGSHSGFPFWPFWMFLNEINLLQWIPEWGGKAPLFEGYPAGAWIPCRWGVLAREFLVKTKPDLFNRKHFTGGDYATQDLELRRSAIRQDRNTAIHTTGWDQIGADCLAHPLRRLWGIVRGGNR